MNRPRPVRVPASSANLGPGFDVMGAALDLHLEVEVVETGHFAVHTDLHDRRATGATCSCAAFAALHPPDDFEFTIRSDIPLSGGLGTSAAAIVAGLMAADSIFELGADLLAAGDAARGPPGQRGRRAAAAGSWSARTATRSASSRRTGWRRCWWCPSSPCARPRRARRCPSRIPVVDAVFNVAHASLLVLGLARGDLGLVARGLARPPAPAAPRATSIPRSWELVQQARELGALGATISGAGPTVLVWCDFGAPAR